MESAVRRSGHKRQITRKRSKHKSPEHRALTLEVLKQFRTIYGAVRRHFRRIELRSGVSGSLAWMLHEISVSPGVGVSELAERLSIHQSTGSLLVEKLVQGGHVRRTRSLEDRRRVGLTLTPQGERAAARTPPPAEGVLPGALMSLSDRTLRKLNADLDRLIARLEIHEADAEKPLSEL